ncbi:hypothetical protein [Clostridium aminobutyricum]|uniref:Uncharacterized protein n=1 Tax=Clostridium aminobutyricum TaxID=33953 RepID=A0A939IIH9_CLOAM|nr:hypothetical protein [Clostridium aminobutyricum]MBN7773096.1 hypothetical protein [Clostridium aminobutyricum]
MFRTTIALIAVLLIIVGIVFLQIFLSKKKNKWLGLILPLLCLGYSFLMLLGIMVYDSMGAGEILALFSVTFITANIPTIVLLAIYAACREKFKKDKEIEKMNIQDL